MLDLTLEFTSKLDKELESGEYFLTEAEKRKQAGRDKAQKKWEAKVMKKEERGKAFIPPKVCRLLVSRYYDRC
jgi:hypothetical protein